MTHYCIQQGIKDELQEGLPGFASEINETNVTRYTDNNEHSYNISKLG